MSTTHLEKSIQRKIFIYKNFDRVILHTLRQSGNTTSFTQFHSLQTKLIEKHLSSGTFTMNKLFVHSNQFVKSGFNKNSTIRSSRYINTYNLSIENLINGNPSIVSEKLRGVHIDQIFIDVTDDIITNHKQKITKSIELLLSFMIYNKNNTDLPLELQKKIIINVSYRGRPIIKHFNSIKNNLPYFDNIVT